ncbi:MAG: hypothetical protein M4579_001551 [Chaenotheca gracillima]|nr:MAG: hypothetical protein M4579_001551 [Chaenotheca gracillima]
MASLSSSAATSRFRQKKERILRSLSIPVDAYTDASPKGSVDEGIKDLISYLNSFDELVTTSSCAGRVCVFVEGHKRPRNSEQETHSDNQNPEDADAVVKDKAWVVANKKASSTGGKGTGGHWLFVSHDPLEEIAPTVEGDRSASGQNALTNMFGLAPQNVGPGQDTSLSKPDASSRLVHFKFEPLILHVLTASPTHAHAVLSAALQAGFRESGAIGPFVPASCTQPMVAIRTAGLSLDSIVGYLPASSASAENANNSTAPISLVSEQHLQLLVSVVNARFSENEKRRERLFSELNTSLARVVGTRSETREGDSDDVRGQLQMTQQKSEWEDSAKRRERKKQEGLKRKQDIRKSLEDSGGDPATPLEDGDDESAELANVFDL